MRHVIHDIYTDRQIESIANAYYSNAETDINPVLFQQFVRNTLSAEIQRAKAQIHYVSGQPYQNADEMRQALKSGILLISTDYNSDPFLPGQSNLEFRAMHDLQHCRTVDCNFDLHGEICAYSIAAKYAAHSASIQNWLFTEIVAQVCYLRVYGEFPVQRRVILPAIYRLQADNAYGVYHAT